MRTKQSLLKADSGFTLVEMLIAVVITVLVGQIVVAMTSTATKSLQRASDQLIVAQQAVRLSHYLKFDISSSNDVFIYDSTSAGENDTNNCRADKWTSKGLDANTQTLSGQTLQQLLEFTAATRVRSLFAVQVQDAPAYTPAPTPDPSTKIFDYESLRASRYWVSYELHVSRDATHLEAPTVGPDVPGVMSIWRLQCDADGVIQKSEPLVAFASASVSAAQAMSYVGTSAILSCVDGTGCPSNVSTAASNVTWYKLKLPYTGTRSTLRKLVPDSLNQFKRRIDVRI